MNHPKISIGCRLTQFCSLDPLYTPISRLIQLISSNILSQLSLVLCNLWRRYCSWFTLNFTDLFGASQKASAALCSMPIWCKLWCNSLPSKITALPLCLNKFGSHMIYWQHQVQLKHWWLFFWFHYPWCPWKKWKISMAQLHGAYEIKRQYLSKNMASSNQGPGDDEMHTNTSLSRCKRKKRRIKIL